MANIYRWSSRRANSRDRVNQAIEMRLNELNSAYWAALNDLCGLLGYDAYCAWVDANLVEGEPMSQATEKARNAINQFETRSIQ